MDLSKEIWHCELYKLQQQAPRPIIARCKRRLENHPSQFGDEYHGNIDRNEAEKILYNYPNGGFLIRDSVRNVGAFALVIRFDRSSKYYVLFYNTETQQHYVGSKYFDNIIDLVQDGLIHMYIESRGANILRQIAEAREYEATPFYKSRFYTLQNKNLRQNNSDGKKIMDISNKCDVRRLESLGTTIYDCTDSSDSGIFNSLKSVERSLDVRVSESERSSTNTIGEKIEDVPVTPVRCKSLYSSIRNKVIPKPSVTSDKQSDQSLYEPIFNCQTNSMDDNNSDLTDSSGSKPLLSQRSVNRSGLTKRVNNRNTVIESTNNSFSHLEKNHNFKQHTFVGPQWCDLCAHFMWGLVAQGVQCFDCGFQAHKKCSDKVASDCFPVMKRLKRVFGIELTSLAKIENRAVPLVFEKLIREVETRDLRFQGIYRISGNMDLIEEVKADLDKDIDSVDLKTDPRLVDLETLTGLVKLFLRQLPIPLITSELYPKMISILKSETNISLRQIQFRDALNTLNSVHFATLEFFIRHLHTIAEHHADNCMTSSNLAIVFSPTLISKGNSMDTDISPAMLISRIQSDFKWDCTIVQEMIDGCDQLFCRMTVNES